MADPRQADQYAALGWRMVDGAPRYLLVTSRRSRRWIFPKGGREDSESPAEAAAREAREEAGVEGRSAPAPHGRYRSLKIGPPALRWLVVELWPVEIDRLADDWLEKGQRERAMLRYEDAVRRIAQVDMGKLLASFHAGLVAR